MSLIVQLVVCWASCFSKFSVSLASLRALGTVIYLLRRQLFNAYTKEKQESLPNHMKTNLQLPQKLL